MIWIWIYLGILAAAIIAVIVLVAWGRYDKKKQLAEKKRKYQKKKTRK